MWCAVCRADVAAELSADNRRMLCARCQAELGIAAGAVDRAMTGPRLQETERSARELLARWSTQHLLETPVATGPSLLTVADEPVRPVMREDGVAASAPPSSPAGSAPAGEAPGQPHRKRRGRRRNSGPRLVLPGSDATLPQPPLHDELVRQAVQQPAPSRGNWTTAVGQLCAYGGVGVLTLGTVMVLSGYFGGPASYAPTGWLVAAVGQMLLFLGVVTLVSGGMEQTVDEVAWRIDQLAEQVGRLERAIEAEHTLPLEPRRRSRRSESDAA